MTTIDHEGTVQGFDKGVLKVLIKKQSACGSCEAKSSCGMVEADERVIEVFTESRNYQVGQKVIILLEEVKGWNALALGYVAPLILVIFTLMIALQFLSEGMAGLLSLGILIPYYAGIFIYRNRIAKNFAFRLKS